MENRMEKQIGKMTPAPTVILASASPRRKQLLSLTGFPFEVRASESEEVTAQTQPGKIVEELSRMKAEAVAGSLPEEESRKIVLGADTIVWQDGRVLGKPRSREEARQMIASLQGNTHSVFTGVTLIRGADRISFHCETKVHVHSMDEEEIETYISSEEPYDKAGGYGIQGAFAAFVDAIEGDYSNVVGLPVSMVYRRIKEMI